MFGRAESSEPALARSRAALFLAHVAPASVHRYVALRALH